MASFARGMLLAPLLAVILSAHTSLAQPSGAPASPVNITVSDASPVAQLDSFFVGLNIDTASVYCALDFADATLIQLAANLAPAQLRIGGSEADNLWWMPSAESTEGPSPDPLAPKGGNESATSAVTLLSKDYWTQILAFAQDSGLELLWVRANA